MKKYLFLLCALLSVTSYSQFIQDIHGRPYQVKGYEEYEGSPLLFKDWVAAKVKASNGMVYDSMLINIDLYQDIPLFFRDGRIYTFNENIAEFTLIGERSQIAFKKGQLIDKSLPDAYYQILSTSPLLVRNNSRKLTEVQSYGEAVKRYRFVDNVSFYGSINGTLQKLSLGKNDAEKVFSSKWQAILDFAVKNKISFKSEEGWYALLNYYQRNL